MISLKIAKDIGDDCVAAFLQDPDMIAGFFAQTGAGADDLRANLDDPALRVAVLDYIMSVGDALVCDVAARIERTPEALVQAHAFLNHAECD